MKTKIVQSHHEKEQALQIRKTVFIYEQHVPPEEEIDAFDNDAIHFIGYIEKTPIAASRLRLVDTYGKLERICVLNEYRGKSYGKQIIKAMEEEIINQGYFKAKLNAQTHAIGFYQRLGYKIVSDEFMDAGIPHVTMIKNL